jgi:hypothetical protein
MPRSQTAAADPQATAGCPLTFLAANTARAKEPPTPMAHAATAAAACNPSGHPAEDDMRSAVPRRVDIAIASTAVRRVLSELPIVCRDAAAAPGASRHRGTATANVICDRSNGPTLYNRSMTSQISRPHTRKVGAMSTAIHQLVPWGRGRDEPVGIDLTSDPGVLTPNTSVYRLASAMGFSRSTLVGWPVLLRTGGRRSRR